MRYAKANNPYLKEYDKQKPSSHIMYIYEKPVRWSMRRPLQTGGIEWVHIEGGVLDPDLVDDDEGCIAEVDFDYPHGKYNNFPLAPESLCPEEWSDYTKSL